MGCREVGTWHQAKKSKVCSVRKEKEQVEMSV